MGAHHDRSAASRRGAGRRPLTGAGELACLAAAACWAIAVVWFRAPIGEVGARVVNFGKCAIATVLLAVTAAALGELAFLMELARKDLLLIALSGVVGMAMGDTALFSAVRHLGAHRTLLLQTMAPIFAAAAAFVTLGERMTVQQAVGGAVVLAAVGAVVASQPGEMGSTSGTHVGRGVVLAVLAALGQALGIVIAKPALVGVPILLATLVRLAAATSGLALVLIVQGRGTGLVRVLAERSLLLRIGRPAILGTYVAVLLMMTGISWAPASIAALLLATSPIFSLFVEAKVDRKRVTLIGLVGTVGAIVGVALLAKG